MAVHRLPTAVEEEEPKINDTAAACRKIGEAFLLLADASFKEFRRPVTTDPWIPIAVLAKESGRKDPRPIRDAGGRGEIQLHKLGDTVVCRRSEFDRWILAHPVPTKVVPKPEESAESVYAKAAGGR